MSGAAQSPDSVWEILEVGGLAVTFTVSRRSRRQGLRVLYTRAALGRLRPMTACAAPCWLRFPVISPEQLEKGHERQIACFARATHLPESAVWLSMPVPSRWTSACALRLPPGDRLCSPSPLRWAWRPCDTAKPAVPDRPSHLRRCALRLRGVGVESGPLPVQPSFLNPSPCSRL